MISKEQLETYRALAAKRGHDGIDASKTANTAQSASALVDREIMKFENRFMREGAK